MKSTSGEYYIALDHIRALAALLVFNWHFIAGGVYGGLWSDVPIPLFPFSLFVEGHTGVALFMTLSGYLFAKLLDNKDIHYRRFLWCRFIRLAPLLLIVILLVGIERYWRGQEMSNYFNNILWGAIKPTLPNGGWSITAEAHFYLLLPLLLSIKQRWRYALLAILAGSIALKLALYLDTGDIRKLSYNTLVGRIDQFLLGILAWQFSREMTPHKWTLALCLLGFLGFYSVFDNMGGFTKAPASVWIYLPAIEGAAYALLILWYDNREPRPAGLVSRFIARIGQYSYSIYLLHFFVVFYLFSWFNAIIPITNIYSCLALSLLSFLLLSPLAGLSYHFIEKPFLRLRKPYLRKPASSK